MKKITLLFLLLALKLSGSLLAQNKLNLLVESVGDGHAKLAWSACQTGVATSYKVERSLDGLSWDSIAMLTSDKAIVEYIDSLFVCKMEVVYRIATRPGSACVGSSDPTVATIVDAENPAEVQIESVSVDYDSNKLVLRWKPCVSKDTWGYRIFIGSDATAFDTLYGADNTTYWVDGPVDTARKFRITAFDSCFNNSLLSKPKAAFLFTSEMLTCERMVRVKWVLPHQSIEGGIDFVRVYAALDGDEFAFVAEGEVNVDYLDIPVSEDKQTYHFYLKVFAPFSDATATSLIESRVVELPPTPDYAYIRAADFTDEQLLLSLHVDTTKPWTAIQLLKNEGELKSIPFANFIPEQPLQLPLEQGSYRVIMMDVCNLKCLETTNTVPVDLKTSRENNRMLLHWTPYEGWPTGVEKYCIWRLENGKETMVQEITSSPALSNYQWEETYADLSMIMQLSYRVEAVEADGNPYGFKERVFSQRRVLVSETEVPINVPTGFVPEGLTPFFRPFYQVLSGDEYLFRIYNRFGELLFESQDPQVGWDGKHKGEPQPSAVYLYIIRIQRQGHLTRKSGAFNLLR